MRRRPTADTKSFQEGNHTAGTRAHVIGKNLSGIKDMPRLPDAIFVIDSNNEQIAVAEARGSAFR